MALGTVYTAAPSWGLDPDWRCREVPSLAVALLDLGGLVITGYLCELTSQAPHTLACFPSHYRWGRSWASASHLCPVTDTCPPPSSYRISRGPLTCPRAGPTRSDLLMPWQLPSSAAKVTEPSCGVWLPGRNRPDPVRPTPRPP